MEEKKEEETGTTLFQLVTAQRKDREDDVVRRGRQGNV